jgi:hypothetical protein
MVQRPARPNRDDADQWAARFILPREAPTCPPDCRARVANVLHVHDRAGNVHRVDEAGRWVDAIRPERAAEVP